MSCKEIHHVFYTIKSPQVLDLQLIVTACPHGTRKRNLGRQKMTDVWYGFVTSLVDCSNKKSIRTIQMSHCIDNSVYLCNYKSKCIGSRFFQTSHPKVSENQESCSMDRWHICVRIQIIINQYISCIFYHQFSKLIILQN